MFTYKYTQLSVTYTIFHKIKTKSHKNNIHRKKHSWGFFFLMIEKLNWRVKREKQKNLPKGSIRKTGGGGINIVKGEIQGPMVMISKGSAGHVIGRDYLVLHMPGLAMVSSWAKFTSLSVFYDENDSELVLSLLVYLPLIHEEHTPS